MGKLLRKRLMIATGALAQLACIPAHAQPVEAPTADADADAADPSTDSSPPATDESGEIVVTAQRVGQSLQRVPLAVTAASGIELQRLQLSGTNDLKYITPNLSIERNLSNPSTPKLYIRGIGVANSAFSFDSPIGIYVDDVYFPRVTGSLIDFFDIDRIEVLRGPQGTIYGRNASIGAIRVVTKAPPLSGLDFGAEATYGSRNQMDARLGLGTALVEDKVGLRLAFSTSNNDGFQTNTINGERAQKDSIWALRGSLLFQVADNASITIRGDYMHDASRPTVGARFLNDADDDLSTFESNLSYRDGTARSLVETWGGSITGKIELGDVNITSITAYRGIKQRAAFDTDGTVLGRFEVKRGDLNEREFTQEVFATGSHIGGLPVDWVAGAFYFHEPNEYFWSLQVVAPPASLQVFDQTQDSIAGYAQGTFHLNDRLSATGGIRYTHENKDFEAQGFNADGSPDFTFIENDIGTDRVTWRAALNFQATPDLLLYASASTGFRSAALNGNAQSFDEVTGGAFGVEDTLMYEAGLKSRLFGGKATANLAGFYGKYSNLQQPVTRSDGTVSTVSNDADVYGIEAELRLRPVDGLELFGALGAFKDNIKESTKRLVGPKFNFSAGGSYTLPVGDAGDIRLASTFSHEGRQFGDVNNTPLLEVPAHDNLNASISFLPAGGHFEITAGGQNLTNDVYTVGGFYIANGFISAVKFPSLPRRYYVRLRYTY